MSRHWAGGIPDAWPALMTREQVCAYLSIGAATFAKICPVAPLDLGANVLRWSRVQIDAWVAKVPPRLTAAKKLAGVTPVAVEPSGDEEEWRAARRRAAARTAESLNRRRKGRANLGRAE
jgi:hypothetical protein